MNKSMLMGRLTKDPEMRHTNNNVATTSFSLAVPKRFKKEGEQQADFINVVAWQKTAEFCTKYFKKGQQVVVIGRIQTRNWEDDSGNRHYVTEIVAEEVYFADSKRDGQGQAPQNTAQSSGGFFPIDGEVDPDELPF